MKLRLINMSDEQLWELARMVSHPPERAADLVYQGFKGKTEKLWSTAGAWMKALDQEDGDICQDG